MKMVRGAPCVGTNAIRGQTALGPQSFPTHPADFRGMWHCTPSGHRCGKEISGKEITGNGASGKVVIGSLDGVTDPSTSHPPKSAHLAQRLRGTPRAPVGERPWVLVNMVSSLDGAATLGGQSEGLGGAADRAMFSAIRSLADVIVVGARTAAIEQYRPPRITDPGLVAQRQSAGQAPHPDLVLLTRSSRVDHMPALDHPEADADGGATWILSPDFDGAWSIRPGGMTDELQRGRSEPADTGGTPEPGASPSLLDAFETLSRSTGSSVVLCEGGPTLLGAMHGADLIDEWCVTIGAVAVSGDATRISRGDASTATPRRLDLIDHLVIDSTILARYAVDRSGPE